MMPIMPALVLYVLLVSLYDLRAGRVPNWVTLPLLVAGVLANFPGTFPVWIACLFVFLAWHSSQMGAGDAKLWMALFWAVPPNPNTNLLFILSATLLGTALLQLSFRKLFRRPFSGYRRPAAWRTIPFVLWSLFVH